MMIIGIPVVCFNIFLKHKVRDVIIEHGTSIATYHWWGFKMEARCNSVQCNLVQTDMLLLHSDSANTIQRMYTEQRNAEAVNRTTGG